MIRNWKILMKWNTFRLVYFFLPLPLRDAISKNAQMLKAIAQSQQSSASIVIHSFEFCRLISAMRENVDSVKTQTMIQIPKAVGNSAACCLRMETCLSHNNATESSYRNHHHPLSTALTKEEVLPLPTILEKKKNLTVRKTYADLRNLTKGSCIFHKKKKNL